MTDIIHHEMLPVSAIDVERLRQIYTVWQEAAGGEPLCPRECLRPELLGRAVICVALIERRGGSPQLYVRLIG
ncbi:MAG TPA: hypothetical protein VE631_01040 [Alphaproteobacteria bacterium]|nr:hypothetical protein [Alphaproteobacteria bacterium]